MKRIARLGVILLLIAALTGVCTCNAVMTDGEKLKYMGLILGDENGKLMENSEITRGQAAVIITRLMGWDIKDASKNIFTDMGVSDWEAPYAMLMYEHKITVGTNVDRLEYSPDDKLTERELYVWFYRALYPTEEDAWTNMYKLVQMGIATEDLVVRMYEDYAAKIYPYRSIIFTDMLQLLQVEVNGTTILHKLASQDEQLLQRAKELGLLN